MWETEEEDPQICCNLSNDLQLFLRLVLQQDQKNRISADQALSHPWISVYAMDESTDANMTEEDCDEIYPMIL